MITDYFMITEKSNRLQVIMITDYDYPISGSMFVSFTVGLSLSCELAMVLLENHSKALKSP